MSDARGSVRVRHEKWWGRVYRTPKRGGPCRELSVYLGREVELSEGEARQALAERLALKPQLVSRRRPVPRWGTVEAGTPIPEVACCYVLLDRDRALYVGQTVNLRARMKGHGWNILGGAVKTEWGYLKDAVVKYRQGRRPGEWLMIEYRLIQRLQPRFNKQQMQPIGAAVYEEVGLAGNRADLPVGVDLYRRPHYTLEELAAWWRLSVSEIRTLTHGLSVEAVSQDVVEHLRRQRSDLDPVWERR